MAKRINELDWYAWYYKNILDGSDEEKIFLFNVKKGQSKKITELILKFANDMLEEKN